MATPDSLGTGLAPEEDERSVMAKHYDTVNKTLASKNRARDPLTGRGVGGTPSKASTTFLEEFYKTTPQATRVKRDPLTRGAVTPPSAASPPKEGAVSDWNKFMTRNIKSSFVHTDRIAGRSMAPMSSYGGGLMWTKRVSSPSRSREVRNECIIPGGETITL